MHAQGRVALAGEIAQVIFVGILVSGLSAQVSDQRLLVGFPEDWTHHRVKFNSATLRQHLELVYREPRAAAQLYREARATGNPTVPSLPAASSNSPSPHPDWSVSLGAGRIQFGQFPAKWQADPARPPSCSTDFIVYALNVAGATGGQANLVAFSNLYSGNNGLCPGLQPNFLFSYNTSTVANGRILTSPVLSLDGTKVAFVETNTTAGAKTSIFHVLTVPTSNPGPGFPHGNSATSSVLPTGGTMTSLTIVANSDTRSSPWVDYASDTAYVAADNGRLYKITNVFAGTPTLATSPWPILINLNSVLTSPVLDDVTGNVFIGAGNGRMYSVNVNSPGAVTTIQVGTTGALNPNIYDSPIIDATGASVFAVSSNDSTGAVVVQASTNTLSEITRVHIGQGSTAGTSVNLYDGDFDNAYVSSPQTGHMLICGTGLNDATPYRYLLSFDANGRLQPDPAPLQISNNARARCGPVTEFYNANINGGTDFFFWGVTRNCVGVNGCVMSLANGAAGAGPTRANGGVSGIVIDNNSPLGQASSIHFSTEGAPLNAVKLTQQGLN